MPDTAAGCCPVQYWCDADGEVFSAAVGPRPANGVSGPYPTEALALAKCGGDSGSGGGGGGGWPGDHCPTPPEPTETDPPPETITGTWALSAGSGCPCVSGSFDLAWDAGLGDYGGWSAATVSLCGMLTVTLTGSPGIVGQILWTLTFSGWFADEYTTSTACGVLPGFGDITGLPAPCDLGSWALTFDPA